MMHDNDHFFTICAEERLREFHREADARLRAQQLHDHPFRLSLSRLVKRMIQRIRTNRFERQSTRWQREAGDIANRLNQAVIERLDADKT
jgi:hypothetical protein